jgi:hypothetical protein
MRLRILDALPAMFMLALAALVVLGTSELRMWRGVTPGPRFFPALLAGTGAFLALALLVSQWRGSDVGALELPDRYGAKQVAATLAALVAFVAGCPILGMVPMVGLFTLVMLLVVLRQRVLSSVTAAVLVAMGIQVVFVQWLKVALPAPFFL